MQTIEQTVQRWLEDVVIGLDLCPFAAKPQRKRQVRVSVSAAGTEQQLLNDTQTELRLLDSTASDELETTLLIVPDMLADFDDYNQFLNLTDELLQQYNWQGRYQIASFHPHYRFAGTCSDDAENLTNRSPHPILHILREASVEKALQNYPAPEQIPERNINKIRRLTASQRQKSFPYLVPGE
ncbi:MAG: DUF1415 domain-containing protein [Pseudomonadales bacterium]